MERYSRRHEAAERSALRRWLRRQKIEPLADGHEPKDLQVLMMQVHYVGGPEAEIRAKARARVDADLEGETISCH